MIKKEINEALRRQKVPTDELDNIWDKLFGSLPTAMLFIGFGLALFSKATNQSLSLEHKLYFFLLATLLFLYTLWSFTSEKKLKKISTNLSLNDNLKLVTLTLKELGWKVSGKGDNYFIAYIPFILGFDGHKLIVIIKDKEILYNLRNVGSGRGRMPYLFGIDTFKEIKLKKKIKKIRTTLNPIGNFGSTAQATA